VSSEALSSARVVGSDVEVVSARLEELIGADRVTQASAGGFSIHGLRAALEARPADAAQLGAVLTLAHAERLGTCVVGGGTKLGWGNRPGRFDLALSTRDLTGFSHIDADNLSLSVRGGTTVAEAQAQARAVNRVLPLDPARPRRATVGGVVATGDQGARAAAHGGVRDVVLGLSAVLADGTPVKFGGRTMKNVSGYDMTKLFISSFGVLGVITDVTFRLLPRYESQAMMILTLDSLERAKGIAAGILDSYLQPLALEVLSSGYLARALASDAAGSGSRINGLGSLILGEAPVMLAGFAGQRAAVARSVEEVRERHCVQPLAILEGPESESLCEALAGAGAGFAADTDAGAHIGAGAAPGAGVPSGQVWARITAPLSRVWGLAKAARSGADARDLPSEYRIGAYRGTLDLFVGQDAAERPGTDPASGADLGSGADPGAGADAAALSDFLADLRREAERAEGALTVRDGLTRLTPNFDAWGEPGSAIRIMRRIKERFDPHGILNPGRFVGGI